MLHYEVIVKCSQLEHHLLGTYLSQSQIAHHLLWTSESEPACTSSVVDIRVRASLHLERPLLWTSSQLARRHEISVVNVCLRASLHVICCSHPCNNQLAHHLFWKSESEPSLCLD
ncbi:hypothetical protein DPMN_113613 [Dreissena polymorpha]|uniref:Uncharacterized protein n=1 Tax=Dreissena polymorpha TaxID=45954 RepID=A0A9D4KIP2_DREPO|nr:hypothetical protein DPMN_113613 [Dreissena polymorpha]